MGSGIPDTSLAARDGTRLIIDDGTPSRFGWIEFTVEPEASIAVSAMIRFRDDDGDIGLAGISPTSTYRQASIYVDNTSGFLTDLKLVNLSATTARTLNATFYDFDSSGTVCKGSVTIPALGRAHARVGSSNFLSCGAGDVGQVAIQSEGDFTGVALVLSDGGAISFTRQLVARSALGEDHPRLNHWTITTGSVTYGSSTSAGCISVNNTSIDGVAHTVHSSKWQHRADEHSAWTDIPNTTRNGLVCAHSNSAERGRPVPWAGGDHHRRRARDLRHEECADRGGRAGNHRQPAELRHDGRQPVLPGRGRDQPADAAGGQRRRRHPGLQPLPRCARD